MLCLLEKLFLAIVSFLAINELIDQCKVRLLPFFIFTPFKTRRSVDHGCPRNKLVNQSGVIFVDESIFSLFIGSVNNRRSFI